MINIFHQHWENGDPESLEEEAVRACVMAQASGKTVIMHYCGVKVRVLPHSHPEDIILLTKASLQLGCYTKILKRGVDG